MYGKAATYALSAGIRTAAQTAGGLIAAVQIINLADVPAVGNALAVIAIGSILSGLAAFLMNFAEMLNIEE